MCHFEGRERQREKEWSEGRRERSACNIARGRKRTNRKNMGKEAGNRFRDRDADFDMDPCSLSSVSSCS